MTRLMRLILMVYVVVLLTACTSTPDERRAHFEEVRSDKVAALARACGASPAITAALDGAAPYAVLLGPEAAAAASAAVVGQAIAADVCRKLQPTFVEEAAKANAKANAKS